MKEEIEQILKAYDLSCSDTSEAAIKLEKHFAWKIIEDLELLKDKIDIGTYIQDVIDNIDAGIDWYKQEYNL